MKHTAVSNICKDLKNILKSCNLNNTSGTYLESKETYYFSNKIFKKNNNKQIFFMSILIKKNHLKDKKAKKQLIFVIINIHKNIFMRTIFMMQKISSIRI